MKKGESPLYIDSKTKEIRVRKGLENYTLKIAGIESPDVKASSTVSYTVIGGSGSGTTAIIEYKIKYKLLSSDTFPKIIYFRNIKDINGDDVPDEIDDAFVFGLQPINFKREMYIEDYDDESVTIDIGSRGEPTPSSWYAVFVIKGGS